MCGLGWRNETDTKGPGGGGRGSKVCILNEKANAGEKESFIVYPRPKNEFASRNGDLC